MRQIRNFLILIVYSSLCLAAPNAFLFLNRSEGYYSTTPKKNVGHEKLHENMQSQASKSALEIVDYRLQRELRLSLQHGFGENGLELLRRIESTTKASATWSEGQKFWYYSLCHRLNRNNSEANRLAQLSRKAGIPELKEHQDEFWWQFEEWDQNYRRTNSVTESKNTISPAADGRAHTQYVSHQINSKANRIGSIVREIRRSKTQLSEAKDEEKLVAELRLATWQLLLGEYCCIDDSLSLWSTAVDSLREGKERLSRIELQIDSNAELEKIISTRPELALRLDTARVRLTSIMRKQELARAEELERLHQLRKLVKDYRLFGESISHWLLYQSLAQTDESEKYAGQSILSLQSVFENAKQRRDYYLFDDEPSVEGTDEFKVVSIESEPFSNQPLSMLKSLQALNFFMRQATGENKRNILQQAEKWAMAALDDNYNIQEIPSGADSNNPLAKLVLGYVEEEKGDQLAFSENNADRQLAQEAYKKALRYFTEVKAYIESSASNSTSALQKTLQDRILLLSDTEFADNAANALIAENQFVAAQALLEKSLMRIPNVETSRRILEIGINRDGEYASLINQFDLFIRLNLIDRDDIYTQILLAKLVCRESGKRLVEKDTDRILELRKDLQKTYDKLREIEAVGVADPILNTFRKAYQSLCCAHIYLVDESTNNDTSIPQSTLISAYRSALDAEFDLQKHLEAAQMDNKETASLQFREALIDCKIAAGHLATVTQGKSFLESEIHFSTALDEASKISGSTSLVPLIASPLLHRYIGRTDADDLRLAMEERTRRHWLTRAIEAMFASKFNAAAQGADQLGIVASAANANTGTKGYIDLEPESSDRDFMIDIPRSLMVYSILADIDIDNLERATNNAMKLAGKDSQEVISIKDLSEEEIRDCINALVSPLELYAFATVLDTTLNKIVIGNDIPNTKVLSEMTQYAFRRGDSLLESNRLQGRLPHIKNMISESLNRFSTDEFYYAKSKEYETQLRLSEAMETLKQGIVRHPESGRLWYAFVRMQLEQSQSRDIPDSVMTESLIALVERLQGQHLMKPFDAFFIQGELHRSLNRFEEARSSFKAAAEKASISSERVRALSSLSSVIVKSTK